MNYLVKFKQDDVIQMYKFSSEEDINENQIIKLFTTKGSEILIITLTVVKGKNDSIIEAKEIDSIIAFALKIN